MGLAFTNTKGQHFYTRPIDKFYIFAGHREHRQNTGNIHGMFVAGVVTKKEGFSSVLILSKYQTNQHRTLHLNLQRLGQSHYNKEMVVINCMNIPKYTLIG